MATTAKAPTSPAEFDGFVQDQGATKLAEIEGTAIQVTGISEKQAGQYGESARIAFMYLEGEHEGEEAEAWVQKNLMATFVRFFALWPKARLDGRFLKSPLINRQVYRGWQFVDLSAQIAVTADGLYQALSVSYPGDSSATASRPGVTG